MASPTKNYTDPTSGAMRWVNAGSTSSVVTQAPTPATAFTFSDAAVSAIKLVQTGLKQSPVQLSVSAIQTPPPPMGTIKIATFPSIYKGQGAGKEPRPTSGQVWPRLVKPTT